MPRLVDYPRASLRSSLDLADAVGAFGGSCKKELAAEKMHKKIGGSFQALIGAAVKYGLVTHKSGKLSITPLYRSMKLAYTDEERQNLLREAFLSAPLFNEITTRFSGDKIPVSHFEKMLIREFEVPSDLASRLSGYYLDGARQANLIDAEGFLGRGPPQSEASTESQAPAMEKVREGAGYTESLQENSQTISVGAQANSYSVRVTGPGLDSTIVINDADDLLIVQAVLRKVEKALATGIQP